MMKLWDMWHFRRSYAHVVLWSRNQQIRQIVKQEYLHFHIVSKYGELTKCTSGTIIKQVFQARLYRCNWKLSGSGKQELEVNDMTQIHLHKSYNSAVVAANGHENITFVEKDCRNYIKQVRSLWIGERDATAIQVYFSKK